MISSEPDSPQSPRTRKALPWLLAVLAITILAVVAALLLVPGSPIVAGPGAPAPSDSKSPSDPADDPTTSDPATTSPTPDDPGSSSPAPGDPSDGPNSSPPPTDPSAPATPSTPASPTSPATPSGPGGTVATAPGALPEEQATELITIAIAPPLEQATTETALTEVLADIAIDGYAEELQAQWLELSSQGWTMTGAPTVASLEITSLEDTSDPVTAEVLVCIDSSEVQMVDAEGESIGDPDAAMARALHRFTMVQADDGSWRVSSHTFPDNPEC